MGVLVASDDEGVLADSYCANDKEWYREEILHDVLLIDDGRGLWALLQMVRVLLPVRRRGETMSGVLATLSFLTVG